MGFVIIFVSFYSIATKLLLKSCHRDGNYKIKMNLIVAEDLFDVALKFICFLKKNMKTE